MKKFTILFAFILILFSSCHSENEKLIIGDWQGVQWLANGEPSDMDAQHSSFHFDDKGRYIFDYGGDKQEGTFKVENDMLFTTPAGEQEIMVKIDKLIKDTLVFNMNRSGRPETLTLVRK